MLWMTVPTRDVGKRQRVAGLDVRCRARHEDVAYRQPERREDVALLAVAVVQAARCRAERLGSYSIAATLAGTPSLLRLKSIRRYMTLMAAAAMPYGDMPVEVAAGVFLERFE